MRKLLAVWAGKMLTIAGRFMGKKSSSSPGEYAMRLCPDLAGELQKCVKMFSQVSKSLILVTP